MECRETQTLLTAFHDGELPTAERARVEEHLGGCPECAALLADLARVDRAAGVPDPGPAYWDRFNARVMDRVEREADGPGVRVLRPKGGWMREQLRYLVPAAAAAALVVVIVYYGGMDSGAPTPAAPPAVSKPAESVAAARPVPPPAPGKDRVATVAREERDRLADRSLPAGDGEASRERAAAPAPVSVPSPPTTLQRAPDGHGSPGAGAGRDATGSVAPAAGSPPGTAADGMTQGSPAERKKMERSAAPMAEPQGAGKAESASGMKMVKDPSAEAPAPVSLEKTRPKAGPSPLASAPSHAASPCELTRTLAEQERFREAEAAQRACLSGDLDAPSREKGLVFLAELLDRQERFAEADAVIAEVDRRFPQSRPLDLYRQQRPMVQKRKE
jgi:hypothetical protein